MSSLAGITLPEDLEWVDEFEWSPVVQAVEPNLGGGLVIEEQALLTGRPITLRSVQDGNRYSALAARSVVEQLYTLASTTRTQANPMALTLPDGRTTTVLWRHTERGFEARPWKHVVPQLPDSRYLITLRLIAVSAIVAP